MEEHAKDLLDRPEDPLELAETRPNLGPDGRLLGREQLAQGCNRRVEFAAFSLPCDLEKHRPHVSGRRKEIASVSRPVRALDSAPHHELLEAHADVPPADAQTLRYLIEL